MCGRFTQFGTPSELEKEFRLEHPLAELPPRYNAALTQYLAVVTSEKPRAVQFFRWGLIPSWAKDVAIGNKLMNARSETINEKPAFRSALVRRRCLVPAKGFYEWKTTPEGKKQPYYFHYANHSLFAMAGLWDEWISPINGEVIRSFTIITTAANNDVSYVHDRMSVMFTTSEQYETWLAPETSQRTLQELLQPMPNGSLSSYRVSPQVNATRAEGAHLVLPEQDTSNLTLFS